MIKDERHKSRQEKDLKYLRKCLGNKERWKIKFEHTKKLLKCKQMGCFSICLLNDSICLFHYLIQL